MTRKRTPKGKAKPVPTKGRRKHNSNRPGKDRTDHPLTASEERFCVEYAKTGNGTAAYKAANPDSAASDASMSNLASRLLGLVRIKSRIAELQAAQKRVVTEKFEADATWIVGQFTNHADAVITDFLEWGVDEVPRVHKDTGEPLRDRKGNVVVSRIPWVKAKPSAALTRQQARQIAGVELVQGQGGPPTLRLKLHDQQSALREIGKLGGHYKEKVQHEHQWIDAAAAEAESKFNRLIAASSGAAVVDQSDEGAEGA